LKEYERAILSYLLIGVWEVLEGLFDGSGMNREVHVPFCERLEGKVLWPTLPIILNTDQGSQYTSLEWVEYLSSNNIQISMDGKGRWADNILIERFWRTIKYENIYINPPDCVKSLRKSISEYIEFYNNERLHQALGYNAPAEIYYAGLNKVKQNN
jgi:putative transposase